MIDENNQHSIATAIAVCAATAAATAEATAATELAGTAWLDAGVPGECHTNHITDTSGQVAHTQVVSAALPLSILLLQASWQCL
jgi:hypothetical protein